MSKSEIGYNALDESDPTLLQGSPQKIVIPDSLMKMGDQYEYYGEASRKHSRKQSMNGADINNGHRRESSDRGMIEKRVKAAPLNNEKLENNNWFDAFENGKN